MAAVAPTQVPVEEPRPEDEAAAAAAPVEGDEDHDEDHNMDEDDEEEHENEVKEWDEGGKSHCGYGDTVHETLMSIGESIHKVVGEPTEGVQTAMLSIGNWFQDASYAARDMKNGKMDIAEETAAAMKSVVTGDDDDNKDGEGEGEGGEHQEDGGGDNKLEPVIEDTINESESSA